jgi:hypothetical protein
MPNLKFLFIYFLTFCRHKIHELFGNKREIYLVDINKPNIASQCIHRTLNRTDKTNNNNVIITYVYKSRPYRFVVHDSILQRYSFKDIEEKLIFALTDYIIRNSNDIILENKLLYSSNEKIINVDEFNMFLGPFCDFHKFLSCYFNEYIVTSWESMLSLSNNDFFHPIKNTPSINLEDMCGNSLEVYLNDPDFFNTWKKDIFVDN